MTIFHNPLVLILFHVIFISILPVSITSSRRTEGEALVKWKHSLLPSSSLNSWSLNNLENLCNWTGITCNTAGSHEPFLSSTFLVKNSMEHLLPSIFLHFQISLPWTWAQMHFQIVYQKILEISQNFNTWACSPTILLVF